MTAWGLTFKFYTSRQPRARKPVLVSLVAEELRRPAAAATLCHKRSVMGIISGRPLFASIMIA